MASVNRHILIVSTNYLPNIGGVEVVVQQQVHYLLAKGHRVTLVTARAGAKQYGKEVNGRFTHLRTYLGLPGLGLSTTLAFPFFAPRTLWQLWRLPKPDLIHLQFVDNGALYALYLYKRHYDVPLVISFHGTDVTHLPHQHRWLACGQHHVLQHANAITACSQALLRQVPLLANVITKSVPNGVQARIFQEATPHTHDAPYLLSIARLVHKKGMDLVLEAFTQLPQTDHHLLIAGDGPLRIEYELLAQRLGISHRVHFLGKVPPTQIPSLLAGSQLFVLGSRDEPFGIVLLEAMAAGKAVVATRVGGVPEFVEDGVNGRLVPPNDPVALAQGMSELLSNPTLRQKLAQTGKHLVSQQYTWKKQGSAFWQIYEQLWKDE